MGNIKYMCLSVLSKAVAIVCMYSVSISVGTMSMGGIYEFEMPAALRPQDTEECE